MGKQGLTHIPLNRTRSTEIPVIIQDHHFLSSGQQPHHLLMNYPTGTNFALLCHRTLGEFGQVIPRR